MDSSDKSVRMPSFDGAPKNFQVWWMRFKAFATVHRFLQALTIGGETDMPATDATVLDSQLDVLSIAAKKRNAIAMANLTMAFSSEATMGLAYKAITTDWPGGLAHLVVKSLMDKYQPKDLISRVELRQMLNGIKMKKSDDPAIIFEQISAIENQYNTDTKKIDEEELIAIVLDVAPFEYQAVLTTEHRMKGTAIKLSDLEAAMTQMYRQMISKRARGGMNDADETEITLSAFQGTCWKCKKKGHRSNKCPGEHRRSEIRRKIPRKMSQLWQGRAQKCHVLGKGREQSAQAQELEIEYKRDCECWSRWSW